METGKKDTTGRITENDLVGRKLPILRRLFIPGGRVRLVWLRIGIFLSTIYLCGIVLTWTDGSIYLANGGPGYVQDIPNYFLYLSFYLCIYLLWKLVLKFDCAFHSGYAERKGFLGVVSVEGVFKAEYDKFLEEQISRINLEDKSSRLYYRGVQILILIGWFFVAVYMPLYTNQVRGGWNFSFDRTAFILSGGQYFAGYLFNQLKDLFIFVFLVPELLWTTIAIAVSSIRIVKFVERNNKFHIQPLAPDNVGGLSELGEISLYLFYISIAPLLHVFSVSLLKHWPISHQVIYPFYFLFTVFVFFAPLTAARKSMKEAKKFALDKLSKAIGHFSQMNENSFDNELKESAINNYKVVIFNLRELYRETNKMSVWPYDFSTFIRFLSGVLIPLTVFLIQTTLSKENLIVMIINWFKS